MKQRPFISCMQKIAIYETTSRYYIVGSNHKETRFRVLKIDRTEPRELHITDDRVEYTQSQIRDLLRMIDCGNRPKMLQNRSGGLSRAVTAFGIVGFVRFLEGYYIILITKRRRVANIGPHSVYKIEDTSTLYIPNSTFHKNLHPDEHRYVKIFHNVDLSSNFYFSYSYDLTRSLQYNLTPCPDMDPDVNPNSRRASEADAAGRMAPPTNVHCGNDENAQEMSTDTEHMRRIEEQYQLPKDNKHGEQDNDEVLGIRTMPTEQFVWNNYLLKDIETLVHCDWLLHIIHGFVSQSNICIFGRSLYLTVIGRRSNKFAGTRYLKRGANYEGNVANEVETEQIVHDATVISLDRGHFTSFVQHRGSVPFHWSQDIAKMVPKPPITVDQSDPYCTVPGKHFNSMLKRYGAPIILLNLVKKREKCRHEGVLSDEVTKQLQYLNQFLPSCHTISYIGFDMARLSKSKDFNVLHRLGEIAEYCVKRTGFFHSGPLLFCNKVRPHPRCKGMACFSTLTPSEGCRQLGVVRTNCVDCLDRTNTAQFVLGKCALAFQLYSLGVIDTPQIEFDTDCVRMLEEMYEDHGDTLALQYGGSQLVHRIKGYRKVAPWTSSSRDIMQSLSRYYSNAFSDSEKQQALNLFLGIYQPQVGQVNLWDLQTDVYLHNRKMIMKDPQTSRHSYSQWWDAPVFNTLPKAHDETSKGDNNKLIVFRSSISDEHVDLYHEYYRPYELTSFNDLYSFLIPNSIRDFKPKFATSMSPFAVRVRPVRRLEDTGFDFLVAPPNSFEKQIRSTEVNPNISGKDSTASLGSTGSEGSSSTSDDSDKDLDLVIIGMDDVPKEESGLSVVSLKDLFPTMSQTYGTEIEDPDRDNKAIYKKFVQIGKNSQVTPVITSDRTKNVTNLIQKSIFPLDSCYSVVPPTVTIQSKAIYRNHVTCGSQGASSPSQHDINLYQQYAMSQYIYK